MSELSFRAGEGAARSSSVPVAKTGRVTISADWLMSRFCAGRSLPRALVDTCRRESEGFPSRGGGASGLLLTAIVSVATKETLMGRSFYLGNEAELTTGSAAFSAQITATPTAFGLVAGQAASYAAINAIWVSSYNAAMDPVTRTKGKVAAKNQAKVNLRAMASDLAKLIDGTSTVTDEQKIGLGLNVRAAPATIPAPSVRPGVDLVSVVGKLVSVRIHDSATFQQARQAGGLPRGERLFVRRRHLPDRPGRVDVRRRDDEKQVRCPLPRLGSPRLAGLGLRDLVQRQGRDRPRQRAAFGLPPVRHVHGGVTCGVRCQWSVVRCSDDGRDGPLDRPLITG